MAPTFPSAGSKALLALAVLFALTPFASPGIALAAGLALALTVGNPWPAMARKVNRPLLQGSVVLLGFGTNVVAVLVAARHGLLIAAVTIAGTFLLGAALRRLLAIQPKTATLLSAGTAICGGSAIAAVALATSAAEAEISVALGTVFLLNAVALFLFPPLGHLLGLSQVQFGTWAGIAIHDVSSVVAAASAYGPEALQTATVVKLSRTLWIIPVAIGRPGRREAADRGAVVHRPVRRRLVRGHVHPRGPPRRPGARRPREDRHDADAAPGRPEPVALVAPRGRVQAGPARRRPLAGHLRHGPRRRPLGGDLTR
jgi:hypothetical protein